MEKEAKKIDSVYSVRFKQLLRNEKITQEKLHELTGISQNTLSRLANGKTDMTKRLATSIVAAFPKYRIEWLLGLDDCATERDISIAWVKSETKRWNRELKLADAAIKIMAISGYTMTSTNESDDLQHKIMKDGVAFCDCSESQFKRILNSLLRFMESRLEDLRLENLKDENGGET